MTETLTKAKTMHAAMTANISKGNPQSDNIKGLTEVSNIISSLLTTIESQQSKMEVDKAFANVVLADRKLAWHQLEQKDALIESLQEKEQAFMRSLTAEAIKHANLEKRLKQEELSVAQQIKAYSSLELKLESQKEQIHYYKTIAVANQADVKKYEALQNKVESQKEEIEEFRERYTDSQFHVKALSDVENVHITEIESLKAITELAVKALKQIAYDNYAFADVYNWHQLTKATLAELARLQNDPIS